jgi:hypothetical protein
MKPVVFDDSFGRLHLAGGSTGVVLCNPFGCARPAQAGRAACRSRVLDLPF